MVLAVTLQLKDRSRSVRGYPEVPEHVESRSQHRRLWSTLLHRETTLKQNWLPCEWRRNWQAVKRGVVLIHESHPDRTVAYELIEKKRANRLPMGFPLLAGCRPISNRSDGSTVRDLNSRANHGSSHGLAATLLDNRRSVTARHGNRGWGVPPEHCHRARQGVR